MITTGIVLGLDGKFAITHKSEGLAKDLSVAEWMFEYCGWRDPEGKAYPCLEWEVERIEWPEGDKYFPSNHRELWVLRNPLQMN